MGGRAVIFGCHGPVLKSDEARFFRDVDPWGFILFARNLENPEQCSALCASLREAVGRNAPILIDQEGGRVARMGAPYWHEWMPALDQADAISDPNKRHEAAYLRARLTAHDLLAAGVDVNCAPLADIATEGTHEILLNRCYGRDVEQVVSLGRATSDGLLAGGVLPILKHIPGHGRAVADSHDELPVIEATLEDLMRTDFAAFHGLSDLPMAMTGHLLIKAIDSKHCATLSRDVVAMMRSDIGFDGLLMTDDLSMKALGGSFEERTSASLKAGCDMILHCNGKPEEMIAIASATPMLEGKAAERAEAALAMRQTPEAFDASLALNRYKAILKEEIAYV